MSNIVINQVGASGPSGALRAGDAAHLTAESVNQGAEGVTGVTVTLALSDGQQGGETFDLAPAESRWVAFDTTPLAAGSYELTVTASDASGQALADNGLSILVQDVQPGGDTPTTGGGDGPTATTDEQRQEGPKLAINWGDSQLDQVDVPEIGSGGEGVA
jgi:hypothetical protein